MSVCLFGPICLRQTRNLANLDKTLHVCVYFRFKVGKKKKLTIFSRVFTSFTKRNSFFVPVIKYKLSRWNLPPESRIKGNEGGQFTISIKSLLIFSYLEKPQKTSPVTEVLKTFLKSSLKLFRKAWSSLRVTFETDTDIAVILCFSLSRNAVLSPSLRDD